MEKILVKFTLIIQDVNITNIMQAVDMFEKGKVIIKAYTLNIPVDNVEGINDAIQKIEKQFQENKDNKEKLIFIGLADGKEYPHTPVFAKDVNIISNGKNWHLFGDVLRKLNYEPVVDDNMFIKEINN